MARTNTTSAPRTSPLVRLAVWLSLALFVIAANIVVSRAFAQEPQAQDAALMFISSKVYKLW